MKFTIPEPLTHEHEELHARLAEATKLKGPLGEAADARGTRAHQGGARRAPYGRRALGAFRTWPASPTR